MRASVVAAAVTLVAACWTAGPGPAPPPLRPEPTGTAPHPIWRRGRQAATPPASDPMRTPAQIAQQLAKDLRASGAQLLTSYIAGPVVVLDLDAGSLTVECDAAAVAGAQAWGQMLADGSRPTPTCRGVATFSCTQFSPQQVLIVELADPDQWRIVSVIVGNLRNGRMTMGPKIGQMRALLASAACP